MPVLIRRRSALWLCALAGSVGAVLCCGCRRRGPVQSPASGWLRVASDHAGIDFVHQPAPSTRLPMPETMAGGAALFDADGDGDLDAYLTNVAGPNGFYRQVAPGRFENATAASGLGDRGYGMGIAIGDIDNDGDPDVYVTNLDDDRLYRNDGRGHFTDITAESGISIATWSSSATFVDIDRDGWLDLYVTQYLAWFDKECTDDAGRLDYCGPTSFPPIPDILLRNTGGGHFEDISAAAGMTARRSAGLGVVADDFNDDGWPDIYVANDAYPNQLWINRQNGTFVDDAISTGVALNLHGQAEAGMGVLAADLDQDGHVDLFMTHLRQETNTYYHSLGRDRGFEDATSAAQLGASSMALTGFGTVAFDVEHDGDLDLFIVNGRVKNAPPLPGATQPSPWNRYVEPNLAYLNDGSARFMPAGPAFAAFVEPLGMSRGLAAGDIDGDGDIDMLASNTNAAPELYFNDAPKVGRWLIVDARDPRGPRPALGARVRVHAEGRVWQRTITAGSSYQSSSAPEAHFGLAIRGPRYDAIEVRWPDGQVERFPGGDVDRRVIVMQALRGASP